MTSTTVQNPSGDRKIKSECVYNATDAATGVKEGAYVTRVIDQDGNITRYSYDMDRGVMTSTTNAKGTTTSYTYNSANDDRIKSVTSGGSTVSYGYTGSNLSSLTYGTDTYTFNTDSYGNASTVKVNGTTLSTNTYGAKNGALQAVTYGNGNRLSYTYDKWGNITAVKSGAVGSEATQYSWAYDNTQTVSRHNDYANDLSYEYVYDRIGRLIRENSLVKSTGAHNGAVEYTYDLRNNLTRLSVEAGDKTVTQNYYYSAIDGISATTGYEKDNLPTRATISSTRYTDYVYDTLNRLKTKTFSAGIPIVNSYFYKASDRNTGEEITYQTTQLSAEIIDQTAYKYGYDALGNITSIQKGERTGDRSAGNYQPYVEYAYDSLNQLIQENNSSSGKVTSYTYDNMGNMTSRVTAPIQTEATPTDPTETEITYNYGTDSDAGWSKLLTGITTTETDANGHETTTTQSIDYDAIGNPVSYLGANMTWFARQLKSYSKDGTNVTYTYDADGLRGTKTVNGVKSVYKYVGGQLRYENRGGHDIYYYYDSYGYLMAIRYYRTDSDNVIYYAATNAQGDVLGLYTAGGILSVTYEYDSWGNLVSMSDTTSVGIGSINPIRYRGYYFDSETGLYYLQSRYYDPQVGRFINSDGLIDNRGIVTQNVYSYCANNPVNHLDSSGKLFCNVKLSYSILQCSLGVLKGCYTVLSNKSKSEKPLTQDQKVFVSTIAAEATVTAKGEPVSSMGRKAMANVIMNRVGVREWEQYTTVTDICAYTGFDGYGTANYEACMSYLNSRDGSNSVYESIINDVIPIYNGDVTDITYGCQLYYTPAAMVPIGSTPDWNFDVLSEVTIMGVDPYYEGRFYKYK